MKTVERLLGSNLSDSDRDALFQLIMMALDIPLWTKHGPSGSGRDGDCEINCLRCRAELWINKHAIASLKHISY